MKHLLLVVVLSGFLPLNAQAVPKLRASDLARKKAYEALLQDAEYLSALSTADRFLGAWITDQLDMAESLLSDQLKSDPEEDFESFIASACPCGYEINHGKKVRAGSYSFRVLLLGPPAGNSRISVRISSIVVSGASDDRWAIVKLPSEKLAICV